MNTPGRSYSEKEAFVLAVKVLALGGPAFALAAIADIINSPIYETLVGPTNTVSGYLPEVRTLLVEPLLALAKQEYELQLKYIAIKKSQEES